MSEVILQERFKMKSPGRAVAAALMALALVSLSVAAQDESMQPEKPVDVEVLNRKIAEVEASTTLGEEVAATLVDLYRRALTNLERGRVEQATTDAVAAAGASAPEELGKIRRDIDARQATTIEERLVIPANTPLLDLERSLTEEKAGLADAEARLDSLRERYATAVARPAVARQRLTQAREELNATIDELNSPAPMGEAAEVTEARRWHLETRTYRLRAELRKLDQQLLSHSARLKLLEAQQEQAALVVELVRARTRTLEDTISKRGGIEVDRARQEAMAIEQKFEDRQPAIGELARGNVDLSDRLARALDIQGPSNDRDAAAQQLTRIENEVSSTRSKLAIAGLNQALGQVLIENRRALPDLKRLRRQVKEREQEMATVGLAQIQLAEQRRNFGNLDGYIDRLLVDLSAEEAAELRPDLQALAASRQTLLQTSIDAGARYLSVLGELDVIQRQLIAVVLDYDEFLGKRLLWIRNTTPIDVRAFASIPSDIQRLLSPSSWTDFMRDFANALRDKPLHIVYIAALLVLGALRRRLLAMIDASAKYVGRIRMDSFRYSLEAFGLTVLAAAPLPLALVAVGSTIASNVAAAAFTGAVAESLTKVGTDLLILQFSFDACRDNGLARKHCGWTAFTVDKLRNELRWFRLVFPALRFIGETSFQLDAGAFVGGLAVLGQVGAAALLGVFIFRLFIPAGGILRDFLSQRADSLMAQWRPVWFGALLGILPLLVFFWLTGYSYAADVIAISFMYSFWFVLGLMVLQSLLARWVLLGSQRLEYKAAIERREAARAAEQAEDKKVVGAGTDLDVEEPEIDVAALDSDSRRLLRAIVIFTAVLGLWLIWSPIIPALGILEEIALWTRTAVVNGESVQVPVTLADLLIAVFVVIATGTASSSLPSLVELVLLLRTTVSAGARYTATTLLRYAIIGTGTIVVFGILGANWSQIQWLVAALGVGIGFGLQEIVANFVSGLIILFERPIRVGDVVTVGNTSGVITRIKIRATTIRDWDRRELLVPNREFITNQLLNWTLTDTVVRLVIPVGVEYGSDVMRAMKLVEEAAQEHESVLEDPAPFVTFDEFGDSALNLTLRAYLPSVDDRIRIASDLRESINRKFKEAGLVIAFPQRDVHIDTTRPLEIRMQTADRPSQRPTE